MGCPVIMGRRTWESIGKPLPGRRNIVVSRTMERKSPLGEIQDCVAVRSSLDDAISHAQRVSDGDEIFVIGGADLYLEAWYRASRLYLTSVHAQIAGDVCFPHPLPTHVRPGRWDLRSIVEYQPDERHSVPFSIARYDRDPMTGSDMLAMFESAVVEESQRQFMASPLEKAMYESIRDEILRRMED